jgi:D-alanine-D-alanine ligase
MESILLKKIRICVLVSNYATSKYLNGIINESPNPQTFLSSSFKPPWEWETRLISKENVFQQINALKKLDKFDVYFNLCNGALNDDVAGIEVIKALDFFCLPYTGCDERFFNLNKQDMKAIALASGVNTPRYHFAFNETDIYLASKHLSNTYPLIAKAFNSHESLGVSLKFKCNNFDELHERSLMIIDKYGGVLVEQFIEGREFSVLVIESLNKEKMPHAMKPVEVEFLSKNDSSMQLDDKTDEWIETRCIPSDNKALNERLCDMAKKAFVNMNGKSYGRVDFRVNENSEIYFIEINYAPHIFLSSHKNGDRNVHTRCDYILENDATFKTDKFILTLIEIAIKNHRDSQPPYCVSFREDVYGKRCLIATRNIMKGIGFVNLQ